MSNLDGSSRKVEYSRTLGTFAVVLLLAGCKTWQPTTLSPERLLADERPPSVRVTVDGGATMTLRNPMLVNDSIVSLEPPTPGLAFELPRIGVSAGAVQSVAVPRFSATRTIGLGAAIAVAAITWARLAGAAGGSLPPDGELPKNPLVVLRGVLGIGWRIF